MPNREWSCQFTSFLSQCPVYGLHFARGRTGRSRNVDQLLKKLFHRSNPIIDRSYFCLAQWYLLAELHQVRFALQELHLRGMFGQIEIAFRTSHAVRTLLEEIVGAVAVSKIVEFPRLIHRTSAADDLLIHKHLNCSQIPREVTCVSV